MTRLFSLSCSPLNNVDSLSSLGCGTSGSVIAFVGLFGVSEIDGAVNIFLQRFSRFEVDVFYRFIAYAFQARWK